MAKSKKLVMDIVVEMKSSRFSQPKSVAKVVIYNIIYNTKTSVTILTLRRPLRRKLLMRWFFDISKVKESSFFKSDLTDPHQIFDAHLLINTDLSPSRFLFSVSFIWRSCFESDGL